MANSIKPDFKTMLLEANDYHCFLAQAFEYLQRTSRFSFAGFARKAGLSSRSFPRDVALGNKRLTLSSAKLFATALGLNAELGAYFVLLVQAQEIKARDPKMTEDSARFRLAKMRERLYEKGIKRVTSSPRENFRSFEWLKIYTSSGSVEEGASFQEIKNRTQMNAEVLSSNLKQMCEKSILNFNIGEDRFYPQNLHFIFEGLGDDEFFRLWYLRSIEEIRTLRSDDFKSLQQLFFTSLFSVRKEKMVQLKTELRVLLQKFTEEAESADGDRLSRLTVGFYNYR